MKRDSFIFYRSFYNAISTLSDEQQLSIYRAIVEKALNGIEPELAGTAKGMYELIKPQIEANQRRYENGCKGGAPLGNQNARKTTKKQPKTTKKQPNDNVNDNNNENNNDNVNDIYLESKKTYGKEFGKVKLTDEEYAKLVERLGQDSTEEYINRLDGWLAEGHQKKNHYATILNWWKKELSQNTSTLKENEQFTAQTFKPSRR